MKTAERLLRVSLLGVVGALAAVVIIWVAGPQGSGHRLPAEVVPLDLADVLADDPDGSSRRLREAMFERLDSARVSLDLDAVPLAEAIGRWADAAGVSIVVRPRELEYEGLDPADLVTLRLEDVPAGDALAEIFGTDAPQVWDVGPAGVVRVPAEEYEGNRRFLRVYDVTDLLLRAGQVGGRFEEEPGPTTAGVKVDENPVSAYQRGFEQGRRRGPPAGTQAAAVADLIEAVQEMGGAHGFDNGVRMHHFAGRLGVKATHEEHRDVAAVIAALRDPGRGRP